MTFTYLLLNEYEALLQPLFQGHFKGIQKKQHSLSHSPLPIWLQAALPSSEMTDQVAALPPAAAACLQGWRAYYGGDLEQARQFFAKAQAAVTPSVADSGLATDIALGFAKVYTRSGHWQTAREWLLYSLSLARKADRLFDSVRGFGALGELFLRAGKTQQALFCLNTAHQLLPPGGGERSRQWNYIASALLRLAGTRDLQTAESLLMSSYYLALDSNDFNSACHALARLQILELERDSHIDVIEKLKDASAVLSQRVDAIPQGFLAMARGFSAWKRNDLTQAASLAQQALHHFRNHYGEYQWAQGFCTALGVETSVTPPSREVPQLSAPPASLNTLNHIWTKGTLSNTGPSLFIPTALDIPSLISHRQVYFL